MDNGKALSEQEFDTVNLKDEGDRIKPEDIAARAQAAEAERDAQFEAKMRATEEEIERMERENAQKTAEEL